MSNRIDYAKASPEGYKAFGGVYVALQKSGLPKELVDLVYLRVSQINGCAYCIDMHSRDLLKSGLAVDKLVLVPVWRDAGEVFSSRERAALAWAETVTRVAETGVPDADYEAAAAEFSDKELADLTYAIGLMNAFNRLGIRSARLPLPPPRLEAPISKRVAHGHPSMRVQPLTSGPAVTPGDQRMDYPHGMDSWPRRHSRNRIRLRHEVVRRLHAIDPRAVYGRHRLVERLSSLALAAHTSGGNGLRGLDRHRRGGHRHSGNRGAGRTLPRRCGCFALLSFWPASSD